MSIRFRTALSCVVIAAIAAAQTQGQPIVYTWTAGADTTTWSDPNNWDGNEPDGYPGRYNPGVIDDVAIIPNVGTGVYPVLDLTTVTIGSLRITGSSATVTVGTTSGTRTLEIGNRDGLTLADGAQLHIQRRGIVRITGGGSVDFHNTGGGTIRFQQGSATDGDPGRLNITRPLVVPGAADSGTFATAEPFIISEWDGIVAGGPPNSESAASSLLILSEGRKVVGTMTIEIALFGHGFIGVNASNQVMTLTRTPGIPVDHRATQSGRIVIKPTAPPGTP